ncbi:MAG: ribonuclease catalytic domain-containing protein [Cyanobacteriota bacterium]|nr:ribonuclease catalytic domain-containing protein [Cyanobacteriota bacterium]
MFHPGDLVGVQESRGAQLAVVEAVQGSKARLRVGFDARPSLLPQRQLQLICRLPSGVDPPQRLGAPPWNLRPDVLQQAGLTRRAWGATWLLLLESGETVALPDFADLLCGGTAPGQLAVCWLELVGPQQWFRFKQGEIQPRSAAELKPLRRERRLRQLVEQREHQWQQLLRARRPVNPDSLPIEQQRRLESLKLLAAGQWELEQLEPRLRQSLAALQLGRDRGDLRHLLVDLGQWDRHHLVSMGGTTWSLGFSPEVEAEAERLLALSEQELPGDEERFDLTSQRCVTVDDDDTRDIDDGLALERRPDGRERLWIHVADPGRLVEPGSPLDREARHRGSSLYLASGNLPMFPLELSMGPFSLRAGVRSAAWSTWVELDDAGAIADYGIVRSWVKPTFRLSYSDADDLIDLAPPEEPDLADLDQLLDRRRQWRLRQGALLMDLPEGRIRSRDGEPVLEVSEPSPSRAMVAEAMILAGALAARFGVEHGVALPFRSQLPADLPPQAELDQLPDGAVRFAAIKRCLSRGLMGTQAAPHFSLGLPAYAQATSPIRRYGDLVVQRQIQAQLSGGSPLSEDALQELLSGFDGAVREGIGISREDQRHWQQVWFEAHKSSQWRADFLRWLRPQDRLGLVRIDDLAMDLAAECPQNAQPGEALLLRVHQVDSLRDQLKLVASAS